MPNQLLELHSVYIPNILKYLAILSTNFTTGRSDVGKTVSGS